MRVVSYIPRIVNGLAKKLVLPRIIPRSVRLLRVATMTIMILDRLRLTALSRQPFIEVRVTPVTRTLFLCEATPTRNLPPNVELMIMRGSQVTDIPRTCAISTPFHFNPSLTVGVGER